MTSSPAAVVFQLLRIAEMLFTRCESCILTVNVVSGWEGAAVCGCYNPGDVFFLYKVRSETQTTANARLGLKIRQTKIFL